MGTLDVAVHEWAPNLNTSVENLKFSYCWDFHYDALLCVPKTCVLFQQNVNDIQRMCFEAIVKVSGLRKDLLHKR
jgi:hypothetical protein